MAFIEMTGATLERIVGLGPVPLPRISVPFGLSVVLVARRPG